MIKQDEFATLSKFHPEGFSFLHSQNVTGLKLYSDSYGLTGEKKADTNTAATQVTTRSS